eukprot:scaffold2043_cov166-Amphora_coffeaeformis.AAC.21
MTVFWEIRGFIKWGGGRWHAPYEHSGPHCIYFLYWEFRAVAPYEERDRPPFHGTLATDFTDAWTKRQQEPWNTCHTPSRPYARSCSLQCCCDDLSSQGSKGRGAEGRSGGHEKEIGCNQRETCLGLKA